MAISVSDTTPRQSYTVGSSGQTTFSVPFATEQQADVAVYVNDVKADYVSSLVGQTGTKYTLNNVGTANSTEVQFATEQSNVTIDIIRDTAISRTSDFNTGGFFDIEDLNVELSRLTRIVQDLELKVDQSISVQPQEDTPGDLPIATSRAGKLLAFDSSGNVTTKTSAITEYLGAFTADLTNRPDNSPLEVGDIYYNTTSLETKIWTGTSWDLVFGRVQPISTSFTSTGNTIMTLTSRPSSKLSILVMIDGVMQNPNNYDVADNIITFTTAPPVGAAVEIRDFSSTQTSGSGTIINVDSGTTVTQANVDISKLLSDMATNPVKIDSTHLSTNLTNTLNKVPTLDTRLIAAENLITINGVDQISDQGTRLTNVEALYASIDTVVNGSQSTSLASRVAQLETLGITGSGNITLDLNRITSLEAAVFESDGSTLKLATAQAFNQLNGTVSSLSGINTSQASDINVLKSQVQDGSGNLVLATSTQFTTVETTANTADGKADGAVTAVNNLALTVGDNTTNINTHTSLIGNNATTPGGVIGAEKTLSIDVNGRITGTKIIAGATSTSFAINSDVFTISDPTQSTTGTAPFEYVNGNINIRDAAIQTLNVTKLRGDVNKGRYVETSTGTTMTTSYVQVLQLDIPAPDDTVNGHIPMAIASLFWGNNANGIAGKLTARTVVGGVAGTEQTVIEQSEDWYTSQLVLSGTATGIVQTLNSLPNRTTAIIRFTLYAKKTQNSATLQKANILGWGLH
jgi:hypothetical protein